MTTPPKIMTPRKSATPLRPPRTTPRRTPAVRSSPSRGRTPTPRRTPQPVAHVDVPGDENGEEGITVAIRMRPLNTKESTEESSASAVAGRVWRVLPQYNSVTQTTNMGQPLAERVTGRTFFSYDKTFGEDASTKNVYDGVAKGIVQSVVTGLNGTIFAYGQTSSGKTFTMQGSGSIEEGRINGGGGIVHMATTDIFDHIQNTPDRIFLVRVSFIEIYNEEVRDLLGDNNVLQVREDPRRGVFVNANEEIVTDFESLLRILFAGEKNRAVAATGMNERSSRSHTIFRITIESRQKQKDSVDSSSDDGAVLISTLNLVDLAGSESVRHTGATGERQKEGAKINQSLLTLSRVIVGLGQPNQGHINFRDSKLTRILQPSLSGNARMAVVCCATPSELYLEETRSTLLFASRAKLVKTKAQVNEVLDDRSMIRRLQRELAEARRQSSGVGQKEQLKALESEAAKAGDAAKQAEEKLERLKSSLLNSAVIFGATHVDNASAVADGKSSLTTKSKKRRLSDGHLRLDQSNIFTPLKENDFIHSPQSLPRPGKDDSTETKRSLSVTAELGIIQSAYESKVEFSKLLQGTIKDLEQKLSAETEAKRLLEVAVEGLESDKTAALSSVQDLQNERAELLGRVESLSAERVRGAFQLAQSNSERERLSTEVSNRTEEMQKMSEDISLLKATMKDAMEEKADALKQLDETKDALAGTLAEKQVSDSQVTELKKHVSELESDLEFLKSVKIDLDARASSLEEQVTRTSSALDEANCQIANLVEESSRMKKEVLRLETNAEESLTKHAAERQSMLQEKQILQETIDTLKESNDSLTRDRSDALSEAEQLLAQIDTMTNTSEELQKKLLSTYDELQSALLQKTSTERCLDEARDSLQSVTLEKEGLQDDFISSICNLTMELDDIIERFVLVEASRDEVEAELEATSTKLQTVETEKEDLSRDLEEMRQSIALVAEEKDSAVASLKSSESEVVSLRSVVEELKGDNNELSSRVDALVAEKNVIATLLDTLRREKSTVETNLSATIASSERLSHEKRLLSEQLQQRDEKIVTLSTERDQARLAVETSIARLETVQSTLESVEGEKVELVSQVDSLSCEHENAVSQMKLLEARNAELDSKLADVSVHVDSLTTENANLVEQLRNREALLAMTTQERDKAIASNVHVSESLNAKGSEIGALQLKLSGLETEKRDAEEKLSEVSGSLEALERRLVESSELVQKLSDEKTALLKDRDNLSARLVKQQNEHQLTTATVTEELYSQIQALETVTVKLKQRLVEQQNEHQVSTERVTGELQSKIQALEAETVELKQRLVEQQNEHQVSTERVAGELQSQIQALKAETVELKQRLAEQKNEHQVSTATVTGELQSKIQALESETVELKQLLTDSNAKVVESRSEARHALEELHRKAAMLDESCNRLSQLEEELRISSERVKVLETKISGDSASTEEKQREIDALFSEKVALEARLEKELEDRKLFEDDLRRLMGEEQRMLVQEAENTMSSLRNENEQLKLTLSNTEAEAFAARQEIDDLQDQNKRLEDTALESEALHETQRLLRDKLAKLAEENARLQSDLEVGRQRMAGQDKSHDDDLATITSQLHRVKAELHANKQQNIDLKRDISRFQSAHETSDKEVKSLRGKLEELEDTALTLKNENRMLLGELESLGDSAKINQLQLQVDRLTKEIEKKDKRIKKLDAVKLTKEQCAQLKKMKEERAQYYNEAEQYRTKLSEAQSRIVQLNSKLSQLAGSSAIGDEAASLKFTNEALETKLRKYAAHCQRLESEKAEIIDSLKSVSNAKIVDGDIAGTIATLCDRLSTTEEECNALSSAESRLSTYLSEIDHLKHEKSLFQESMAEADKKLARLSRSEESLQAKLTDALDAMESLRSERDHLKSLTESVRGNAAELETEKRRQVCYLEQENLQLLMDLKSLKKQNQSLKTQLDAVHMSMPEDETVEFGSVPVGGPEGRNGSGVTDDFSTGWMKEPVLESQSDKENQADNCSDQNVMDSAKKQRFVLLPRSSRKLLRATPSRAVGLGEAGEANDEHTGGEQECKQS